MSDKKVVLITGANGGIGYLTAEAIATESLKYHVLVGSRSLDKGKGAVAELQTKSLEGSVSLLQLDVTDQASIENAVATIARDYGRLDVLINNAGVSSSSPEYVQQLHINFETNVFGPALVTTAFLPLLQKSEDARIIYLTSSLGSIALRLDTSNPGYQAQFTAYRMSKAALNMLMACNKQEFEGKRLAIKGWAFCPGYVKTGLGNDDPEEAKRKAQWAGDAHVSAEGLKDIVFGKRDAEVWQFVHKDGTYPW
ncbi:hypothetical protein B0O99DRAFT_652607 [Bisporella sp. PMI_857]|nr:hypothetical protein B0O99DRAFT_652607 [Bisporella sp. PMI_857]